MQLFNCFNGNNRINRINSFFREFFEGFCQFYIMVYKFYKYTILDIIEALKNRNTFSIKKFSKDIFFLCYLIYSAFATVQNVNNFYKFGYWNANVKAFNDSIYIYYFIALFYTLTPIYVYLVKPIVKKVNKYKSMKAYFPKLMETINSINIENCYKEGNETFCRNILKNNSNYDFRYNYKNKIQTFTINRFKTAEDEIITDFDGYDVLEVNINKLNFYDFQLEYLFFSLNSENKGYKCTIFDSNVDYFDAKHKYPKLCKKIEKHIQVLNERTNSLKKYTPICDDIIDYVLSQY